MVIVPTVYRKETKGVISYEYNPFNNFRDSTGKIDDFETDLLNFDLEHPVSIECQQSYDGSVNLILNDGINPTRLINNRFTVKQNNTYEVIDRTGNSDTNLYDKDQFDLDTSLFKKINTIPKVEFLGLTVGGNLLVGNYNFYFKYADADGNETDFIAESGNVVCHIGSINDPYSIRSGIENENSGKIVQFTLSNLDPAYEYIKVFYSRQTSSAHNEPMTEYVQIIKGFKVRGESCLLNITGFEETLPSTLEEINKEYFNVHCAKSIAQCKNRLFLANVTKPTINYQDFQDVSLRMLPYYQKQDYSTIATIDDSYYSINNKYGYYDVKNIYNNLGYWNEEIYRLGVVYILADNSLTPVFNIRGANGIPQDDTSETKRYTQVGNTVINGERNYITYDSDTYLVTTENEDTTTTKVALENVQGVIRINDTDPNSQDKIYNICVKIDSDTIKYLKETLGVKGLFFVRQKRIPNILTQAFVIGHDKISGIPLIPTPNTGTNKADKPYNYNFESFVDSAGYLSNDYTERLVTNEFDMSDSEIAICPDYTVRQELYNNFFTDTNFIVKRVKSYKLDNSSDVRHYCAKELGSSDTNIHQNDSNSYKIHPIIGVPDGIPTKRTRTALYSSCQGSAESYDFGIVGTEFDLDYENDEADERRQIVRGKFGPFIGVGDYRGEPGDLINIYVPEYSEWKIQDYFTIRYEDQTPYYAVSPRIDISTIESLEEKLFRGDCYICKYTQRLNRNFQDLSAPTNDEIVDTSNWYYNYRPETAPEKLTDINIGDLNAVRLGSWITFTVRSNINLSMRDEDSSNISEALLNGVNRSFYPLTAMSTDGNCKIPESSVINTGTSVWNSQRVNFIQPSVPALKNNYQTRIVYSDVAITDAYKNGYRTYQAGSYRDYPTTYGGIMKILEVKNSLLVVFEHGIGLAPVNERIMTGSGAGGSVSINTSNVLPETLNMITTDYGTQWSDSVIQTPHGVYGVDTVAKKIWKYAGSQIELLSDDKMQKFLNDNIFLSDKDVTPIVGIRNVKSHYNAFKKDVMFTFYNCKDSYEDQAWNLCYNEYSGRFITFYSWIPSFSANIDNIHFSFDRNTAKKIAKLDYSKKDGICVSGTLLDETIYIHLDSILPKYYKAYVSIKPTILKTNEWFMLSPVSDNNKRLKLDQKANNQNEITQHLDEYKVIPLNIEIIVCEQSQQNINDNGLYILSDTNPLSGAVWKIFTKQIYLTKETYLSSLTTDFWKHGQGGLFEANGSIKPCLWYGEQHPFEFEYSVNVSPDQQKTFDNMSIISNNVKPESFHYEIVGDTYDFAEDKLNMYVRQELTKHLYQLNGSDIVYNPNYIKLLDRVKQRPIYNYNKSQVQQYDDFCGYKITESQYKDKSTLFSGYYSRKDTLNEIYDSYVRAMDPNLSKNYSQLSGGEIKYDPLLDQFSIINHVKAIDVKDPLQGRLRGNTQYINDSWITQINPLNFVQKNETTWEYDTSEEKTYYKIPLNIYHPRLIDDISNINESLYPKHNGISYNTFDTSNWGNRKEAKLKDKYMKVKIRYAGDKLALITGVRTTFRV